MIVILAIENHKNDAVNFLCNEYLKRTKGVFRTEIILLPAAKLKDPATQKEKECESVLKALKPDDTVFLCDENGNNYHTLGFTQLLQKSIHSSRGRVVFVIGGAYGFTGEFAMRFLKVRLSDMTLPHHLARLILAEQIYRAYEIDKGSGYHHV